MFAIYNNGSVGFRSTADNLYKLKKTESPNAVFLKPDDDTLFEQLVTSQKEQDEKPTQKDEAIKKYKQMANLDTSSIVYTVEDIMNRNIILVDTNYTIKEAYETLKEHKVSQIPVLNNEKNITGLINKKIILNMLIDNLDTPNEVLNKKLDDIFLPEVITTEPITDIRRVAKVMIDFKIDAIPVVDQNENLLGIVSKSDIIKAVSNIPHLQLWS